VQPDAPGRVPLVPPTRDKDTCHAVVRNPTPPHKTSAGLSEATRWWYSN